MPLSPWRLVPCLSMVACGIPDGAVLETGGLESGVDTQLADDPGPPTGDGDDPCVDRNDGGYGEGQRAQNWAIQTADGHAFELYDHCGDIILIEIGAQW